MAKDLLVKNLATPSSATTAGAAQYIGDMESIAGTVGSYSAAGTLSMAIQIQGSMDNLNWVTCASVNGSTAAANGILDLSAALKNAAYLRAYTLSYTSGTPQVVVVGNRKTP